MSKFGFTIDKNSSLPLKALAAVVVVASTATTVIVGTVVGAAMVGAMVINTALGSLATTCVWASGKLGFSPNRSLGETSNIVMPNFIQIELGSSQEGALGSSQPTKKDKAVYPQKTARFYTVRDRAEYKNANNTPTQTTQEVQQEQEAQEIEYSRTRGF